MSSGGNSQYPSGSSSGQQRYDLSNIPAGLSVIAWRRMYPAYSRDRNTFPNGITERRWMELYQAYRNTQDSVDTSHEHSEAEHASGDRGTTFTSNDEQSQDSRPTVSLEQLRSISERVFCPVCKITAYTDIQETEPCTEIDTWILYSTWVGICLWSLYLSSHSVWAFLLFILSIFSVKRCLFVSHKNVEHRCGNCQTLLAVWERGEYIVLQELPGVE